MRNIKVGEWVKGPFANATIEGFIVSENDSNFSLKVRTIETNTGQPPDYLQVDSVLEVPKVIINDFFRVLNEEQQLGLIEIASELGMYDWAKELAEKFSNNESIAMGDPNDQYIRSVLLKRRVLIKDRDREELYRYYLKAIENGLVGSITSAKDINTAEKFDAVLAAIILISNDSNGLNFLKVKSVMEP